MFNFLRAFCRFDIQLHAARAFHRVSELNRRRPFQVHCFTERKESCCWPTFVSSIFRLLADRCNGSACPVDSLCVCVCVWRCWVMAKRLNGSSWFLHEGYNSCISLLFSERELTSTFAICYRASVCLSYVTLVRPTQAVQIFGNISTALGTVAIRWHPLKISRRSFQGNPSAGGVKHKRGSQV